MTEREYLEHAFLLAKKANPKLIRPNPFVGAIVVCENGKIIGEGYHQKSGEAHAEVIAINNALLNGAILSSSTLYVTLEPCSHTGKTPPCTNLIIEHKIPHVVIGSLDPNPIVSGVEILEQNGVKITKILLPELSEMNDVFRINQLKRRPKYIIKSATTLNGKIADRNGESKWISNEKSRAFVHENLRSNVDAILSSAKSIITDNARLNIRHEDGSIDELNTIVIDQHLDLLKEENASLSILNARTNTTLYIVTNKEDLPAVPNYIQFLKVDFDSNTVNFEALHSILLSKNICSVLVEAGAKLNATLLHSKCIDEIYSFICPSIISDSHSKNVYEQDFVQTMEQKTTLTLVEISQFDEDILVHYKVLD
jgi:diaminohydroxyphosphoribosylaminopyrimidine deaminase/5-amino-6-(5-phosphoribosylamino)uracil reductase